MFSTLYETNKNFVNTGLVLLQKYLFYVKILGGRQGREAANPDIRSLMT